jgi:mRNA (2'-O-methyladenosine-N6-)-methyltransferase
MHSLTISKVVLIMCFITLSAGVALGYSQLTDNDIIDLPVPQLQSNGFLFVWVINAKYKFTLDLFEHWGYT